ncbi:MAG: zinc-binding alcohol dehydrogenase family protein [Terriglobales bacterium]
MKAAVLHALGAIPRFEDFPDPQPGQDEVLVHVTAASLKNIDKVLASGTHYGSDGQLPTVCGVDGVGVLENGTRVFCGGARRPYGMMATLSVVPRTWCVPVPEGVDDCIAAALPNPALSSWLPLTWRAQLKRGETVLVLGATGVAGKLAVQIAKHLGAGRVVAAGRNERILQTLASLGADATISLSQSDEALALAFRREALRGHFDIVLDYVWGHPTEVLLAALTGHDVRAESRGVRLIEIGEMAGPTILLSAAALRSSGIEISGTGGGSVPHRVIFDAFPKVWSLAASGQLHIDTERVPLADVESAWRKNDLPGWRLVIVP